MQCMAVNPHGDRCELESGHISPYHRRYSVTWLRERMDTAPQPVMTPQEAACRAGIVYGLEYSGVCDFLNAALECQQRYIESMPKYGPHRAEYDQHVALCELIRKARTESVRLENSRA